MLKIDIKKEFLYFAYCIISNYIAAHGHYFFFTV